MRTKSVLACITVIAGTIGAGSAFAQSASPGQVGGTFGSMTCSDFTALSHPQQASIAGQIKMDAPATSLTSNSGSETGGAQSGSDNAVIGSAQNGGALGIGTPLNSGQLIAACQAAPVSATLQDAYSSFTSGGNTVGATGSGNATNGGSSTP